MTIKKFIRTVADFPKPGIQYRDITSLLEDASGLRLAVDTINQRYRHESLDYVAGIEARGFIFGTAVAYALNLGFIPVRKTGKLPGETIGENYQLEYGEDRIEIHKDALEKGARVLLLDDLVATGGTAAAAVRLIESTGAIVHECCFVVDLPDLGGAERLRKEGHAVHSLCSFEGD